MKILSESVPASHPQEVLVSKAITSMPISAPTNADTYTNLTSVVADTYDKQELNNIFESLMQGNAFPDPSADVSLMPLIIIIKTNLLSFTNEYTLCGI